jgi:cell division protein FtsB
LTVPSRYTFSRVDDGFLRLDNSSGQIAFCSPHSVGWACQAVPEDRAALEKEIARLQDEVASLKTQISALRAPPPRPPADLTPPSDKNADAARLREDMERARAAIENAWRRLVDMIVNFQKDMMHKS